VDANLKQVDNELSMLPVQLETLLSSHQEFCSNLSPMVSFPLPAAFSLRELEMVNEQIAAQCTAKHREVAVQEEQVSENRASLAGKYALLRSQRERIQLLAPRLRLIVERENELRMNITALNALRNGPILNDSGLDPLPFNATVEDVLQAAKATEEESRELMTIARASKAFQKRLNKLRQQNPGQCPCCGQGMSDPNIIQRYEIQTRALFSMNEDVVAALTETAVGSATDTIQQHSLLVSQCTEVYGRVQSIHSSLLPLLPLRSELAVLEESSAVLEVEHDALAQSLRHAEQDWDFSKDVLDRMLSFQRNLGDLVQQWSSFETRKSDNLHQRKRLLNSLSHSSSCISSSVSTSSSSVSEMLSFDDLEARQRSSQARKDSLSIRKDQVINEESILSKKFFGLQTELSECKASWQAAQLEGNRFLEVESSLRTLSSKIAEIDVRRNSLQRDRELFQRDATSAKSEWQRLRIELENKERDASERTQSLRNDCEYCQRLTLSVDESERKFQEMNLGSVDPAMERLTVSLLSKQSESEHISKQVSGLENELSSEEHVKRNVNDNIMLRSLRREQRVLRQQEQDCVARHGAQSKNLEVAERQRQIAEREKATSQSELDNLSGRRLVIAQNVLEAERKLAHPDYKDIDDRFRRINVEFETTQLAVSDINNYYCAL
jgi:hypothetical protein